MNDIKDRARFDVFVGDTIISTGNLATVLWMGPDAGDDRLADIARAEGTPVSAFLLPGPVTRVRFFTVEGELAFCGHGILAAGYGEMMRLKRTTISLETGSGRVTVDIESTGRVRVVLPGVGYSRRVSRPARILAALGLVGSDLGDMKVRLASAGSPKWLVQLASKEDLVALQPDMDALCKISRSSAVNGAYVFVLDHVGGHRRILARGFNPAGGVPEDAATGAAAAALALSLEDGSRSDWIPIDQGIRLQALNRIWVRAQGKEIQLAGNVLPVMEELPCQPPLHSAAARERSLWDRSIGEPS